MNILYFAPFQAVHVHAFPQAYFARIQEEHGHHITWLGCDKMYSSFCVAHSAFSLKESSSEQEKLKICQNCHKSRKNSEKIFSRFKLLDDYYLEEDSSIIDDIVTNIQIPQIKDFTFKGYPLGRLASYEFLIHHKIYDIASMNETQFEYFKLNLKLVIQTLISAERFFSQNKFDRVLIYNTAYSVNNAVREVALRHKIPVGFMHGGYNLAHRDNSLYFSWQKVTEYDRNTIDYFVAHQNTLPLDYKKFQYPLDHIREQFSAKSVFTYSSKRTRDLKRVEENLGLNSTYKKIVLLVMSSSDEAYAADFAIMNSQYLSNAKMTFKSQIDWIQKVIEFFKNRPQDKLIIRVHPREYPNKREKTLSPRTKFYVDLFKDLPHNIVVDEPQMQNSIYDLFDLIDLQLLGQTTTGAEAGRLGIPGIGYVRGLGNYPIEAVYPIPSTVESYFKEIENTLSLPAQYSSKNIRTIFEWYLFMHTNPVYNFSTQDFWGSGHFLWKKFLRRGRQILGLPRFSLSRYLKSASISQLEKDDFIQFIETQNEIYKIREASSQNIRTEIYYFQYLIGLFELCYEVKISDYKKFHIMTNPKKQSLKDEVYFYQSTEIQSVTKYTNQDGHIQIGIPVSAKTAWFLATEISQLSDLSSQKEL